MAASFDGDSENVMLSEGVLDRESVKVLVGVFVADALRMLVKLCVREEVISHVTDDDSLLDCEPVAVMNAETDRD